MRMLFAKVGPYVVASRIRHAWNMDSRQSLKINSYVRIWSPVNNVKIYSKFESPIVTLVDGVNSLT